jgi:periplasmic protein TonB
VFDNLIESKARRQRTLGQSILSLVVHGVLIFVAVKATQGVAEEIKNKPVDTTMVFLKPPEPPPPPPPPPPQDVVVSANPPPKGFQTVVNVVDIPKEIPPVDLNQKPFDPKDFTGKGVEGGIATGVTGGTGPVDVKSDVYMSTEIDDPASVVSVPTPRYPPAMQSAGIAGQVVLEFVVDQTGHAEPNSIKVVSSTNKQFEESAREAVLKAVFRPGKNKGQPIRQLVRLPIVFKL